ncbi:Golgin, RAB6-interacting [Cynara cardunculus var. scolymus]|uniref:RAB6-interacting golgin n=1 Tax=Cynara cardunculus var. scolymus TaxID=59895 RepID=A0A103XH80_CYNCS|nr:Golgin, RAB6-interacting [Cynara cardunculus var. scolymus]
MALQQQQQSQVMTRIKNSGLISYNGSPMNGDDEEELSRSALLAFRVKEEEIKKKKMEVREKVHAQLDRVGEETKKLAEIRQEKEYREALEAFNEKNKEKSQLLARLMELVTESERVRMKKLEELNNNIESLGQFTPRSS